MTEEISRSLNSLESLENGRLLLCFPHSGGSLESLDSLEFVESGQFLQKTPFSDPGIPLLAGRSGLRETESALGTKHQTTLRKPGSRLI